MNIHINEATRETDVWLTRAERNNPCASMLLDGIIKTCCKSGYIATIFVSGTKDLNESAQALVLSQPQ